MLPKEFKERFEKETRVIGWALRDPVAIADAIKEWMIENAPEKIGTAYWIITTGEKDKGFSITLLERPLPFRGLPLSVRASAFLGSWSAGVGVGTQIYKGQFRKGQTLTVNAYVGVFAPYTDIKGWHFGAGVTIPFKS